MAASLPTDRQAYILRRLDADGTVSTIDLSRALHVSGETIRRDFVTLAASGLLRRVYGGAVAPHAKRASEPPYVQRTSINAEAKHRIGELAAVLAGPRQSVFIDVGTTTMAVAAALPQGFDGTVVTHSLLVANTLADHEATEVLLAPGRLRRGEWSLTGTVTFEFLSRLRFDLAFLSCGGIDSTGATDFTLDDVEIKRSVAAHSDRAFVLADSSKHHVVCTHEVVGWHDIAGLITNTEPPEGIVAGIRQAGGEIVTSR